ncbi:MAG: 6-carboxytetrahydropterin synthase QueD [Desulfomonilaceae bacterium]
MYEVEIISNFSAAHRLRNYHGKCEHLHGHNYRVHVTARASSLGEDGMVIDFGDLKRATNRALEPMDHSYLNEIKPFDLVEPSAENIAAFLFDEIGRLLNGKAEMLHSVSVWESDASRATFVKETN